MPIEIPPEGRYSEAEIRFIESSPPGLWPDNQDSYFGQLRKVIADVSQELRDQLLSFYVNMVPQSADLYLANWEEMVGLPRNPTGKSVPARRAAVLARLLRGAFTRRKRDWIIGNFVQLAVGGDPAKFVPEGIDFRGPDLSGGIPFWPEHVPLTTQFQVYEWVQYYYYKVFIGSGYIGDMPGLVRELKRITPAGITFDIDDTRTIPISYYWLLHHIDLVGYWPLIETAGTDAHDLMLDILGNEQSPGTYGGGVTLNDRALTLSESEKSPLFDGVDGHVTIPNTSWLDVGDRFTVALILWMDTDQDSVLVDMGTNGLKLSVTSDLGLIAKKGSTILRASDDNLIHKNHPQLIGYSKDGSGAGDLWINGQLIAGGTSVDGVFDAVGQDLTIGRAASGSSPYGGNIGWVALADHVLTPAEWRRMWNEMHQTFSDFVGYYLYPGPSTFPGGGLVPG